MASFTINKCEFKKSFEGNKGGEFAVYNVELKDSEGQFTQAEMVQKSSTPAPEVGQVVEGTVEAGQYGMKFEKAQAFGGNGGGRSYGKSPQELAEMRRMSAQKQAIALLAVEVQAGKDFKEVPATELLKPRIQWFFDDLEEAGRGR